jgi:hypothetical protein
MDGPMNDLLPTYPLMRRDVFYSVMTLTAD